MFQLNRTKYVCEPTMCTPYVSLCLFSCFLHEQMTSAVDRTADFIQSVQLSRGNLRTDTAHLANGFPGAHEATNERIPLLNTGEPTSISTTERISARSLTPMSAGRTALHRRSEFTQMASAIGRDLANTFGKLEQLNGLALRQSLFDDHSTEIQQLTYIIKEDMADLNHRIASLQDLSKSQKTTSKQQANHSRSVLMGLQTRLAKMSNQFRGLLEKRSENLRSQAQRRGKYTALQSDTGSSGDLFSAGIARPRHTVIPSVLLRDDERARNHELNGTSDPRVGSSDSRLGSIPETKLMQQLSLVDQTETYLASRADTMRSIEHTIVELGEIFQQLATMVHEQDESIRRIDTNVEDAATSIEAGHSELVRYLRSVSSNRWLMLKVFGVLIFFFIIFVVFFV
ncbi:Syntaxin 5 variant [Fasciola hepatica]|uniref:Syntaxin 5 variant n=1 Tax=Fasciola hepatica TaxID=6192 RepID=A0A4E0RFK7_FASHE|nr:Syntaxin 5 variant [Fasciola hepatica]